MTDIKQEIADHNTWMRARMQERARSRAPLNPTHAAPKPGQNWRWDDPLNNFVVHMVIEAFDPKTGEITFGVSKLMQANAEAIETLSKFVVAKHGHFWCNVKWSFWEDCIEVPAPV